MIGLDLAVTYVALSWVKSAAEAVGCLESTGTRFGPGTADEVGDLTAPKRPVADARLAATVP